MSKRHFNKIAAAIRLVTEQAVHHDLNAEQTLERLVDELCDVFQTENPLFDRTRFKTACTLPTVPTTPPRP